MRLNRTSIIATSGFFISYYYIVYDRICCMLLAGVIDDRGKFISITPEELDSVARFIRQRGRVSITELAQASNSLINLMPESRSAAWWTRFMTLLKNGQDSKLCGHFTQLLVISTYWTVYDIKLSSPSTWQQWLCIVVKIKVNMWKNWSLSLVLFPVTRLLLRSCHTGAARGQSVLIKSGESTVVWCTGHYIMQFCSHNILDRKTSKINI